MRHTLGRKMAVDKDTPERLTRRAKGFVQCHGHWTGRYEVEQYRARWMDHGIPAAQVDRVASFEAVWPFLPHLAMTGASNAQRGCTPGSGS